MKTITTCIFIIFLASCSSVKEDGTLYAFYNKDTTRVGYKDAVGKVIIPARFNTFFTPAETIDEIASFSDERDGKPGSGYVTNTGTIVARDSLYIFDFTADCESEGFIRFRGKQELVGLLNGKGKVVIPAEYNWMENVTNGVMPVLKGATKEYLDEEHPTFKGGQRLLIDTKNKVLIKNFEPDHTINLYSMKVGNSPEKDSMWQNFKGVNGKFYCFIDFEKEFECWFKKEFLKQNTKEGFLSNSFSLITYWSETREWMAVKKEKFVALNWDEFQKQLYTIYDLGYDINIHNEELNYFTYTQHDFDSYYDNCGNPLSKKFPVMEVYIQKNYAVLGSLTFLRTEAGYKLIQLSLPR